MPTTEIEPLTRVQHPRRRWDPHYWWREEIGLGVQRCPLPSIEQVRYGSDWDLTSPRTKR